MGTAIVLDITNGCPKSFRDFVAQCLAKKVKLIAVWGPNAPEIEVSIDWEIVFHPDPDAFILTGAHEDETLDEVGEFVLSFPDINHMSVERFL